MWYVWDKISEINGFSATDFLARNKHLQSEETIFVKEINGKAAQVESKSILASHYDIDSTLGDEEFIAAYETIVNPPETDNATEQDYLNALAELGVTDEENNA